jgi:CxxC motif-containing protein
MRSLICIVCPKGCKLLVNEEDFSVSGNSCERGEVYGRNEVKNPLRILTTSLPIKGAAVCRCPVKTAAAIPKGLVFEAMKCLAGIELEAPVKTGQVVLADICGTGVPVIVTRDLV